MLKYITIILIIVIYSSANLSAQLGELFYPLEGDAIKAVQEESPDMEIYAITTSKTADLPATFDTAMFKSDMWIYMMRSKQEPYQYIAYGVFQMGKLFIPNAMDLNNYDNAYFQIPDIYSLNYKEHDVMDKLRENPVYGAFRAYQPDKQEMFVILMKPSSLVELHHDIPESFLNTEIWAFNFSLFNYPNYLVCLVNAKTGDVFCYDEIDGVEELANAEEFEVYPNPANESISLSLGESAFGQADIIIYDVYGREAKRSSAEINYGSVSIPIVGLPPGSYYIHAVSGAIHSVNNFIKIE